ncbi:prolyl 4-hydroxylase subunit alpha-2 [Drosophila biarmipes]|uniref:prolyl 4-hydroxylase subunit alpha-2 n=1 Tax=Drosophila biarmipes TaxID=125945 RepID=UPI0007E860CB|nr:prolyl 4-hydroxylase subunit alpha-2 [Drosophila biarmipes]
MKSSHSSLIFLLFWVQAFAHTTNNVIYDDSSELYSSSVTRLLKLLEMEENFMENIKTYTNKMAEKVKNLQAFIDSTDYKVKQSLEDREKYVGNPLNAFSLVRRTHQDLPKWHNYSQQLVGMEELYALEEILAKAPNEKDMENSLREMHRLEKIYDLEATDLARGRVQNKQYDINITIRDCIVLGEHKLQEGDYKRASMWFRMALKHEPEENAEIINNILGDPTDSLNMQYADSMIIFGMIKSNPSLTIQKAREISHEALNQSTPEDVKYLINELLNQTDQEIVSEMNVNRTAPTNYELGCRGRFSRRNNLVCSYNFNKTEFLRIAPLKQEVINVDPHIVIYHKVISDEEIARLKQDPVSNLIKKRILRRITDMTGYPSALTDDLKVSDLIPGSYDKPLDKFVDANQTGTLIFFLDNVEQGGATVFPKLEVSIFPQKGSCLFWYNIFDNGYPDPRVEALECPVLQGNKLVIKKQVHKLGNICRPQKGFLKYKIDK